MKALHNTLPELTPEPIAWGTFAQADNVHFFLCEFVDMTDDLPDVEASMKMLAELHAKSSSPNGQYGFHVPTLQGTVPQYTEWTDSWEDFFTKSIRTVFENEERSQGPDEEVQYLCKETLSKVIPRLLRPLETGGRRIEPRLIHGDIWDGNTSTNVATNLPVIYDATCIYAHNERKSSEYRSPGVLDQKSPMSETALLTLASGARASATSSSQNGETIRQSLLQTLPDLAAGRRPR